MESKLDGYEHEIIEPRQKSFMAVLFVNNSNCKSEREITGAGSDKAIKKTRRTAKKVAKTRNDNTSHNYDIFEWKINRDGSKTKIYKNHEQRLIISLKPIAANEANIMIVIGSQREKSAGDEISLKYTDWEARQLLTRIFHDKMQYIEFRNQGCEITKVFLSNGIMNSEPSLILKDIIIGKDGGFASSENRKYQKVVGALIYSRRTKIYESVSVTYNQVRNEYYMDGRTFVNFVCHNGAPRGHVYFVYRDEKQELEDLRDESILFALGYNANSKEGLSDNERQDILSVAIDLKLMSKEGILSLLRLNISLHNNEKYEVARRKWERDINFVYNYKTKSEGFIIAKNI